MTTTATTDKLPDFDGNPVHYSAVKISGAATGFSEGLRIAPVVFHNGHDVYFVVRATVAAVDHPLDKDAIQFRRHDLKIADMAPIDEETARNALQQYAAEIERLKAAADGQEALFAEEQAEAREALDESGTPTEVAFAAAERVKG